MRKKVRYYCESRAQKGTKGVIRVTVQFFGPDGITVLREPDAGTIERTRGQKGFPAFDPDHRPQGVHGTRDQAGEHLKKLLLARERETVAKPEPAAPGSDDTTSGRIERALVKAEEAFAELRRLLRAA